MCPSCGISLSYPEGTPAIRCSLCKVITTLRVRTVNEEVPFHESLIAGAVKKGYSRNLVLLALETLRGEGKPTDDLKVLLHLLKKEKKTLKKELEQKETASHVSILPGKNSAQLANSSDLEMREEEQFPEGFYSMTCVEGRAILSRGNVDEYLNLIRQVVGNPVALSFSFLEEIDIAVPAAATSEGGNTLPRSYYPAANAQHSGLNVSFVTELLQTLAHHPACAAALVQACASLVTVPLVSPRLSHARYLQALFQCPVLLEIEHQQTVLGPLLGIVAALPKAVQDALIVWWSAYDEPLVKNLLSIIQQFIIFRVHSGEVPVIHRDWPIIAACRTMRLLYYSCEMSKKCAFADFYNASITENVDWQADFTIWRSPQGGFSFCYYPFLLDPATKSKILRFDALLQMEREIQKALVRTVFQGQATMPYLVLKVRREYIIQDTLQQLAGRPFELKKQLRVQFVGEDGIDAGGVQKEFFQLVVREIFDTKYGMWTYDDEQRTFWFSNNSVAAEMEEFELVGTVLGLAIYNGVILDVHFPFVIYRKLMGFKPTFLDLQESFPELGRGLKALLTFEGDVEGVFARDFTLDMEMFGKLKTYSLKANGENIAVTDKNREEYVSLYTKFILEDSIQKQFAAFKKGFERVCGGDALHLCRSEELEQLICGSADLDFEALEKVAVYDEGYSRKHPVIVWFWEVVHALSYENKKKLLFFATGSDRVPIKGLGTMKFLISRHPGSPERLPTAHTCFNQLVLPEYRTKEKLESSLMIAILHGEGFGLK